MSLLKLWNSIRGRSQAEQTAPTPSSDVKPQPAGPSVAGQAKSKSAAVPAVAVPSRVAVSPQAVTPPKSARTFGIFGSASPHAGLCKLIKPMCVKSVLEIGVDDGSRAIAVLETLAKNLPATALDSTESAKTQAASPIRYIVIDQFEMGGGTTTLKQFHQTLRGAAIRPQVFPEPIERGLTRVAHTIGAVDLILISTPTDQWQTTSVLGLIARVSRADTKLIYRNGDTWQAHAPSGTTVRRAA